MTARWTLLVAMTAALAATSVYLALARWAAGDLATLAREVGRREAMNRRLAAVRQVSEGKHRIVAELIVGRITLREAAARFGDLNALLDDGNDDVLGAFPVVTGEEALCRSVYSWVVNELRDGPESVAVLDRLATEYRRQFGHDPQPLYPWPSPGSGTVTGSVDATPGEGGRSTSKPVRPSNLTETGPGGPGRGDAEAQSDKPPF